MGLDVYIVNKSLKSSNEEEWSRQSYIELDDNKYPEHLFKIGYFRSSYNNAGINSVARTYGLPDLYDIFSDEPVDDYEFTPNWKRCLAKAKEVLEKWQVASNNPDNYLRVIEYSKNPFMTEAGAKSEHEALVLYHKEMEKPHTFEAWSNLKGFFSKEPLQLMAVIHGKNSLSDCVYLIVKPNESPLEWHVQAIEIVVRTIEWVLSQSDPDQYEMHWSS